MRKTSLESPCVQRTIRMEYLGRKFDIIYRVRSLPYGDSEIFHSCEVIPKQNRIVITQNFPLGRMIEIEIPRSLIDSKRKSADAGFSIAVNGKNAEFDEQRTSNYRMVVLRLRPGCCRIDVTGTQICGISQEDIPEPDHKVYLKESRLDGTNSHSYYDLAVMQGQSVSWINSDKNCEHNVRHYEQDCDTIAFDSGVISHGESYTIRIHEHGTFYYISDLKHDVKYKIVVCPVYEDPNTAE